METRLLGNTYTCIPCREKAGHGEPIGISWKGYFYGCEHIDVEDLKESGYFK